MKRRFNILTAGLGAGASGAGASGAGASGAGASGAGASAGTGARASTSGGLGADAAAGEVAHAFTVVDTCGEIVGWLPAEVNEGLALWHVKHDDGT